MQEAMRMGPKKAGIGQSYAHCRWDGPNSRNVQQAHGLDVHSLIGRMSRNQTKRPLVCDTRKGLEAHRLHALLYAQYMYSKVVYL